MCSTLCSWVWGFDLRAFFHCFRSFSRLSSCICSWVFLRIPVKMLLRLKFTAESSHLHDLELYSCMTGEYAWVFWQLLWISQLVEHFSASHGKVWNHSWEDHCLQRIFHAQSFYCQGHHILFSRFQGWRSQAWWQRHRSEQYQWWCNSRRLSLSNSQWFIQRWGSPDRFLKIWYCSISLSLAFHYI